MLTISGYYISPSFGLPCTLQPQEVCSLPAAPRSRDESRGARVPDLPIPTPPHSTPPHAGQKCFLHAKFWGPVTRRTPTGGLLYHPYLHTITPKLCVECYERVRFCREAVAIRSRGGSLKSHLAVWSGPVLDESHRGPHCVRHSGQSGPYPSLYESVCAICAQVLPHSRHVLHHTCITSRPTARPRSWQETLEDPTVFRCDGSGEHDGRPCMLTFHIDCLNAAHIAVPHMTGHMTGGSCPYCWGCEALPAKEAGRMHNPWLSVTKQIETFARGAIFPASHVTRQLCDQSYVTSHARGAIFPSSARSPEHTNHQLRM